MPTATQYEIVKQQCMSFEAIGYSTIFKMQSMARQAAPKIVIEGYLKQWRFCDPDWDVVSKQLAELYKNVKKNRKI